MRREIAEETGYRATSVRPLGHILTSPGFSDEGMDLFLCEAVPNSNPTEDGVELLVVPFAEAVRMVLDGSIEDAKSMLGLLLAELRRG
jgi:ADP-ribose pyrophosphatase